MTMNEPRRARVFLVEDDPIVRRGSEQALALAQIDVLAFGDAESALAALAQEQPWAVVTDVKLPRMGGLELLAELRKRDRELPVILATGHGDVTMAVEAMREGAYDFIEKPFSSERLVDTVRRATERRALVVENRHLREQLRGAGDMPLIGQSPPMQELRRQVAALAPAAVDVLLRGETGSGKEVVARALHAMSGRAGPFVAVNCGALPENIVESELFGHEAGAFTGATKRRVGRVEYAHHGTLFLDEIESMPLATQVKLLRVLQDRRVERLGGNQQVAVDCRVVAAAKDDLKELAAQGRFRPDLYYRLNVVSLAIPPLRERPGDVPLLMAHFVREAAQRFGKPPVEWSDRDMLRWQQYGWPGNVRELRNVAERVALGLPDGLEPVAADPGSTLPQRLEAVERSLIRDAMAVAHDNVARAAELLGIPKKTLYDKLGRLK
ncbi:sigma-54-dependent transcriptional regulator [Ramlibacter albus]|uniref:Sigma-54-dependent Fis family transcriptional regulator n=1 Tax=Ramlibacter albus TaxID=2079448 RepID=A0A923MBH5_9BURK|nr:sigma-54 dependent transcriptional regulator [Ramlibacter albus]MBC5767328.1 sigma-54-dependent Fis family transcriptional regulator [Ramlibacter albus]